MLSDKRMTKVLLILNGSLLALLLLVQLSDRGVQAQAPGGGGGGGATMAIVIGEASPNQDEPIFVVDSRNETLCCYEFNVGTHKFGLKAARTYKYDKQIPDDWNNERPSVKDVRAGRLGPGGK